MTDRERDCVVTTIGAVAGAIASYLLFTERGTALRRQIVPTFEEFERELDHFKGTITRTVSMASEGWKLLNELVAETAPRRHSIANPHQTVPF